MTTIILPTCPNCSCSDIRYEMWVGYKCFKCGYVFEKEAPWRFYTTKGIVYCKGEIDVNL